MSALTCEAGFEPVHGRVFEQDGVPASLRDVGVSVTLLFGDIEDLRLVLQNGAREQGNIHC